jgi:hypothetical protein
VSIRRHAPRPRLDAKASSALSAIGVHYRDSLFPVRGRAKRTSSHAPRSTPRALRHTLRSRTPREAAVTRGARESAEPDRWRTLARRLATISAKFASCSQIGVSLRRHRERRKGRWISPCAAPQGHGFRPIRNATPVRHRTTSSRIQGLRPKVEEARA